jgi:hypothetical protein
MARSVYSLTYPNVTGYTKRFEYSLDGENYVGEYHILDGLAYTGPPKIGKQYRKVLTKYYSNQNNYIYDKLNKFEKIESTYITPIYVRPVPQSGDYRIGFIVRYLLQETLRKDHVPVEVGQQGLDRYGKPNGHDSALYTLIQIQWKVTGPLYDIKTFVQGQTQMINGELVKLADREQITPGIIDENKRTIDNLTNLYPALPFAFKNYQEFAQPTIL